jgi:Flp pilus assembly protein CpaB
MQRNNRPIIIAAVVLGLLALLVPLILLRSGGDPAATGPNGAGPAPTQETPQELQFVAIRDIPPRTLLTPALFRQEEATEATPNAIKDLKEIAGQISNEPIYAGQALTAEQTTSRVRRVVPANIPVPPNARAVAIYVNPEQTAAGLTDVGDRVDVIATHKFALSGGGNQRVSGAATIAAGRVIGQNLLVLAVDASLAAPTPTPAPAPGTAPAQPAPPAPPAAPPPGNPNQEPRTRVVLAAPIEVAARLVAAQEEGKLHVVLRNPASNEQFPVPEAREYPSRIVQMPSAAGPGARNAPNATGNTFRGMGQAAERPSRRRSTDDMMGGPSPSIPAPNVNQSVNVPPAPVPFGGGGTRSGRGDVGAGAPPEPALPTDNEVTVIRGTEKTRVLVPR